MSQRLLEHDLRLVVPPEEQQRTPFLEQDERVEIGIAAL
ncbi:hypothetical protein Pd630_LPD00708 [Rhodococcus opacus PD630]|nr:hypothetical protein Pd630_LPD00708 [Rhodococcus opacus PD630]